MRQNYKQHWFVFIAFVLMMTIINPPNISAESVLLDVSDDQQSKGFYIDLDGEWNFFEQELLTPNEVKEENQAGKSSIVSLPASFETQTGDVNSFGTYRTRIKIPKEYVGERLAIHIPFQYSAYTLYIDQTKIAENGVVGQDTTSHTAEMAPKTGYFIAEADEFLLTMQVSSFDHIRGGFENSIYLGEAQVVDQKFNIDMFVTIFIIGLFMVLFSLNRRQEHVFFIFGIFAMLIAVRALFAVPFYYTTLFLNMSWLWGTRLEYILTEATSMIYVILLWKWHEQEFPKKVMYVLVAVHIGLIVTTLFTQPVVFQTLFFNVFYLAVPTFFYLIYVISKSIRQNNRNAKVNLIGMGIIFLAFFNDFALGQGWHQSVPLMLPAVGVYVVIHVILMSKDFATSIRKTEQQNKQLLALNASNEELTSQLQAELKQKDNFLANTSHELRNPLHGIINIAQSLLQNRSNHLDEKTQHDLSLQLTIGHHMARTLEDLLDVTRLKEHRIRLQRERIDLQAVTSGVVDMLKVLIENKNIEMEVRISNELPSVAADKNRLIQILFNLLHNAVKYTDEGMITIDADVKNEMAHIHISDTGIGMDEQTLQTVFTIPSDQKQGIGIVNTQQRLKRLYGKGLQVTSELGVGTTITITVPTNS